MRDHQGEAWPEAALSCALELATRLITATPQAREAFHIIDIGAHEGQSLISTLSRVTVPVQYLALEPNPKVSRQLQRLAKGLNSDHTQIEVLQHAAGPQEGSINFMVTEASAVAGVLSPEDELQRRVPAGDHIITACVEVPMSSVDRLISDRGWTRVNLLKIDAEGFDLEVLRGAAESLELSRVDIIVVECFFVAYRKGQHYFWDIAKFLADFNYYFFDLLDTRHTGQGRLYTGNGIWVSSRSATTLGYL